MKRSRISIRVVLTFCTLALVCKLAVGVFAEEKKSKKSKSTEGVKTHEVKFEQVTARIPDRWENIPNTSKLAKEEYKLAPVKGDSEPAYFIMSFFIGGKPTAAASTGEWIDRFETDGRKVKVTEGTSPQGKYTFLDITGTIKKYGSWGEEGKSLKNARILAIALTTPEDYDYYLVLSGPNKTVAAAEQSFRNSIGADVKKEKEVKIGTTAK